MDTALDIGRVGRHLFCGQTLQHPQGFNRIDTPKETGSKRQIVDLKGRLPALGRIREDVMYHQKPPVHDMFRPAIVVGEHCFKSMSAIDEHQTQRSRPASGGGFRTANDGNHSVF